ALFARRSALARRFLYSTLGACLAYLCVCCFHGPGRCLHVRSSPTRRSSDLELKAHYTRGGLGDVKVKRFLNEVIQEELEPIRKRRKEYEKDIPAIYEILKKGSEKAEEVAAKTLSEVKAAMKINYFDDAELIREQAERFQK